MANTKEPSLFMKQSRAAGLVPDWIWYQINGKSAQENYQEQHDRVIENALTRIYGDDEPVEIKITSEVKKK